MEYFLDESERLFKNTWLINKVNKRWPVYFKDMIYDWYQWIQKHPKSVDVLFNIALSTVNKSCTESWEKYKDTQIVPIWFPIEAWKHVL